MVQFKYEFLIGNPKQGERYKLTVNTANDSKSAAKIAWQEIFEQVNFIIDTYKYDNVVGMTPPITEIKLIKEEHIGLKTAVLEQINSNTYEAKFI